MRQIFWRSSRNFLKTIAHTLNMSMKRKALQNKFDDGLSSNVGRPSESFTIEDAIRLVSFISISSYEIAIVCVRFLAKRIRSLEKKYFALY